jgi:ABC-type nitrate/sulfonate/bicarbonate transport system substrate-binding protein
MQNAGLDSKSDIRSVNLDIYEQNSIIQRGTRSDWGQVDALVGFDPTPAILEVTGKARMLHIGQVVSLILMSNDFIEAYPETVTNLLEAFLDAYLYFALNPEITGRWFQQESRLEFDPKVLDICASVEPNYHARRKHEISLQLSESDLSTLQEAADFIFLEGLVKKQVNMNSHVDLSYLRKAEEKWLEKRNDEPKIRPAD